MLERIDIIAGQLREAALDPDGWRSALDSVNAFVGGAGAVILSVEERLKHAPHSTDLSEMMDDYFRNGWYADDHREGCIPLLLQKGIVYDHECLEIDDTDRYYAEFLSRHGRKWFAGVGANLDGALWCLALQRSVDQGPFLASDLPRLVALQARLADAAALSRLASRHWLDGALSALDGEGPAIVVLDRTGCILEMNAAAWPIVCGSHGTLPRTQFEDALRAAFVAARRDGSRATRLSFEFEQKSYEIAVTPLLDKASLVFSRAHTLVRIRPRSHDPEEALRSTYRLTRSEVRVAMALASGLSVEAMSATFAVSAYTIRAQLKAAYAKTETGSQGKLVAFIARLSRR